MLWTPVNIVEKHVRILTSLQAKLATNYVRDWIGEYNIIFFDTRMINIHVLYTTPIFENSRSRRDVARVGQRLGQVSCLKIYHRLPNRRIWFCFNIWNKMHLSASYGLFNWIAFFQPQIRQIRFLGTRGTRRSAIDLKIRQLATATARAKRHLRV